MHILRLKCTKFDFRCSTPEPDGGAYSAPQTLLLYLRGLFLTEGRGRGGERNGKVAEAKGGESCPQLGSLDPTVAVNGVDILKKYRV